MRGYPSGRFETRRSISKTNLPSYLVLSDVAVLEPIEDPLLRCREAREGTWLEWAIPIWACEYLDASRGAQSHFGVDVAVLCTLIHLYVCFTVSWLMARVR